MCFSDDQFLFNNTTPSRKNSMLALKGTAVSQSFGGNTGSSKEMQADIASFSSKQQQVNGQQQAGGAGGGGHTPGGHPSMQRAASVGVNGGNILRVAVNTNSSIAAPGSQSPSINNSLYGGGSPGHQGFAPKKMPSIGGSGDWSAAAAIAASNANAMGYQLASPNNTNSSGGNSNNVLMPPLNNSSPSTKRMLQTGAAH